MIRYYLDEPAAPGITLTFERQTLGSSGYDVHANSVARSIQPCGRFTFRTGLYLEMPLGVEAQIRPRSGLARDHGVMAMFGSVDSDYRGEIGVTVTNLGDRHYEVLPGDRIAQLVFAPVLVPFARPNTWATCTGWGQPGYVDTTGGAPVRVASRDLLTITDRGASGYGSSGR